MPHPPPPSPMLNIFPRKSKTTVGLFALPPPKRSYLYSSKLGLYLATENPPPLAQKSSEKTVQRKPRFSTAKSLSLLHAALRTYVSPIRIFLSSVDAFVQALDQSYKPIVLISSNPMLRNGSRLYACTYPSQEAAHALSTSALLPHINPRVQPSRGIQHSYISTPHKVNGNNRSSRFVQGPNTWSLPKGFAWLFIRVNTLVE